MKINVWSGLAYILDILTLSTPRDRDGAQTPLGGVRIDDGMPVGDLAGTPTFGAPKRGSGSFVCAYPEMKGYKSCHGPEQRDCWLTSIQNSSDRYDIESDYEFVDSIPVGITRKVSLLFLTLCSTQRT